MSSVADIPHLPSRPKPSPGGHPKSAPPSSTRWLHLYDDFITKNAHQVSQIESALRSLTYIIPGRFRDAEIASESIHSGVQLLSLYHDALLRRALTASKLPPTPAPTLPAPHSRYTRFWTAKSALYRRAAYILQIVTYVELLCEMAAKRRGERTRWRVVLVLEAVKAACKLLLLRITRGRPLVTPVLPEREPLPEDPAEDSDEAELAALEEKENAGHPLIPAGSAHHKAGRDAPRGPNGEWIMPRTGMALPALPAQGDISGYLLSRVLTADDIKPANKLMNTLQGTGQVAEVLHILAPLVYVVALSRSKDRRKSWSPWVLGLAVELAARQLRDRGLRTTPLEREEWNKRGWAMGWWAMRGAFYENVTKGAVEGVRRRVPSLVGGILEDYEYLWENYYFSTAR
ncbi:peroxisome membrane protein [Podospora conica]|nr:peroxisome membrane protein [Schizothecium conicum]